MKFLICQDPPDRFNPIQDQKVRAHTKNTALRSQDGVLYRYAVLLIYRKTSLHPYKGKAGILL